MYPCIVAHVWTIRQGIFSPLNLCPVKKWIDIHNSSMCSFFPRVSLQKLPRWPLLLCRLCSSLATGTDARLASPWMIPCFKFTVSFKTHQVRTLDTYMPKSSISNMCRGCIARYPAPIQWGTAANACLAVHCSLLR